MQHHTPSSSRPLAARLPGQLHTPTHSLSEAGAPTPDSGAGGRLVPWTEKKAKDDFDIARARLSDQKFSIKDYEDPLLPRKHPQSHYYPKGVTTETEARLQNLIALAKTSIRSS
ncbi:hypothetical protein GGS23DRAFT_570958 [Durotheca rogersii]|uniref:uncharacterized protein n=1 Tax=Durotheca rogersii TaxID=419775 RepID=UPI0022203DC7|nr:uncharacterized protein GGS23DRAFT_570958 [Durotheca rogersii]KAI5862594.1 hypothetical protein GGS23DRAFT_570958 [Durotheca rogersii]